MDELTLGLVCARSGSSGLPGKNLLHLSGEKLIERAIRIASETCDAVAVSTDYTPGVDFDAQNALHIPRPHELAGPDVSKWDVWQHAAKEWEKATRLTVACVVDVDVSRPLRTSGTVGRCVHALAKDPVVMAVARGDKHPSFDILRWGPIGLTVYGGGSFAARQQLSPVWVHAGCYGITRAALFKQGSLWDGPIEGVKADRVESYDIDDELDWHIVEALEVAYARSR